MVYSAPMKLAIGAVRKSLTRFDATLNGWDERFRTHGEHQVNKDAPLILVACSGGRDSLALAAAARTVCTSWGLRCGAVIVDHSMQQGSAEVAARAAKQCADLGLEPVIVERIVLDPQTMRQRGSEAAARQMRYETITRVAGRTGAEAVLLAHTRNDQAETVLINLLTSGGLDGMAGMPERTQIADVALLRPLLDLTRADTTQICESLGLEFWDDPTNGEFLSARNACGETDTSDESSQHASSVSSDSSQPSAGHGTSHGTSHGTDCVTDYATAQRTSRPPFPRLPAR
ncbi:tRNA(Ile)-lysidine synthetase [Bifidobacterium gallicum DSM 20093 = LMG 11596]|uniref:tRNA(Ile)-lysidine synthase n=1 Tax=Bifidobacterium gallicum DSM 20093 = LMG 11596 TaxID=561180 RepID=D1NV13_9BIFI|nr:tRNA lysidine(34) synthetase TilS [Bifidobacterium gallicum]EFA22664.1 tRNA(Ile)-lysidine synthetase [Bifidobacterium gallicum DSM 20093 = LMG 11596]